MSSAATLLSALRVNLTNQEIRAKCVLNRICGIKVASVAAVLLKVGNLYRHIQKITYRARLCICYCFVPKDCGHDWTEHIFISLYEVSIRERNHNVFVSQIGHN